MNKNYYYSVGKRKTSVAKIYLKKGTGKIMFNNLPLKNSIIEYSSIINISNLIKNFDINVKVYGGGWHSQIDAIKHGLAKALLKIDNNFRSYLKKSLLLRRDSRIKERRKYGLKKARKASQYSKR